MATEQVERVGRGVYIIHWSAVLAGGFVALGAWIFFQALGAAIGTALAQERVGTWVATYTLIAPIVALFFGGLLAARSSGIGSKGDGALHGVIIWGFTMVVGGVVLGTIGSAGFAVAEAGANVPESYLWAVAASILGSLIAAVLGASTVSRMSRLELHESLRDPISPAPPPLAPPPAPRREAHP